MNQFMNGASIGGKDVDFEGINVRHTLHSLM